MKMYICIKENTPIGQAAHGSLICHLKYNHDTDYQTWLKESFKKVTCKVSLEEFENLKKIPNHAIITESNLDNREIAIVFKPRPKDEWPALVTKLGLWR